MSSKKLESSEKRDIMILLKHIEIFQSVKYPRQIQMSRKKL